MLETLLNCSELELDTDVTLPAQKQDFDVGIWLKTQNKAEFQQQQRIGRAEQGRAGQGRAESVFEWTKNGMAWQEEQDEEQHEEQQWHSYEPALRGSTN